MQLDLGLHVSVCFLQVRGGLGDSKLRCRCRFSGQPSEKRALGCSCFASARRLAGEHFQLQVPWPANDIGAQVGFATLALAATVGSSDASIYILLRNETYLTHPHHCKVPVAIWEPHT